MKFKVGDKVRVKEVGVNTCNGYVIDEILTVKDVRTLNDYCDLISCEGKTGGMYDYRFELVEPALVFPFKYYYRDPHQETAIVTKGDDGFVTVKYEDTDAETVVHWTVKDVKQFIKNGWWIVTEVGDAVTPFKATTSTSGHIGTLTLNVDNTQAIEAIEALTEAVIKCTEAYDNMQKIMKGDTDV